MLYCAYTCDYMIFGGFSQVSRKFLANFREGARKRLNRAENRGGSGIIRDDSGSIRKVLKTAEPRRFDTVGSLDFVLACSCISYKEVICNEFFRTDLCRDRTRQRSRLQINNKRDFSARQHFGSTRRHTRNNCSTTSVVRRTSKKR